MVASEDCSLVVKNIDYKLLLTPLYFSDNISANRHVIKFFDT